MLTQQNCDTIKLYVNKICLYDIKRYLVGDYDDTRIYNE